LQRGHRPRREEAAVSSRFTLRLYTQLSELIEAPSKDTSGARQGIRPKGSTAHSRDVFKFAHRRRRQQARLQSQVSICTFVIVKMTLSVLVLLQASAGSPSELRCQYLYFCTSKDDSICTFVLVKLTLHASLSPFSVLLLLRLSIKALLRLSIKALLRLY
jgi:hypothetical protein